MQTVGMDLKEFNKFGTQYSLGTNSRGEITLSFLSTETELLSIDDQRSLLSTKFEPSLKKFVKRCLLTVVYNCIDELEIISRALTSAVHCAKVTRVNYESLEERFGKDNNYGQHQLDQVYTDIHKLQKNIGLLLYLLDRLVDEMKKYGTCTLVAEYMQTIIRMRQDEEDLINLLHSKRTELDSLRQIYANQREITATLATSCDNIIKDAMRSINHETEAYTVELNYVKKWENARLEQNFLMLQREENSYTDITQEMRFNIMMEERCHEELEAYIDEANEDAMEQIQGWMDHYEGALESKEMDIYNLKMEMEKIRDKFETLKLTYEERSQEMEAYLEIKRKRKEKEDFLAFQNWTATKIQAWWRGVMVRFHLGPYRKKKGKGKDKEKGKAKSEKTGSPKKGKK